MNGNKAAQRRFSPTTPGGCGQIVRLPDIMAALEGEHFLAQAQAILAAARG